MQIKDNLTYLISKKYSFLIMVMVSQFLSALFFSYDIVHDLLLEDRKFDKSDVIHYTFEIIATISLWVGGSIILSKLVIFLKKINQLQLSLKKTSNQLYEQVVATFETWNLSPSESDVALLIIKGFNNFEIANIRKRNEGTIKSQTSKIYEKARVRNRSEFIAQIIEDFAAELET